MRGCERNRLWQNACNPGGPGGVLAQFLLQIGCLRSPLIQIERKSWTAWYCCTPRSPIKTDIGHHQSESRG